MGCQMGTNENENDARTEWNAEYPTFYADAEYVGRRRYHVSAIVGHAAERGLRLLRDESPHATVEHANAIHDVLASGMSSGPTRMAHMWYTLSSMVTRDIANNGHTGVDVRGLQYMVSTMVRRNIQRFNFTDHIDRLNMDPVPMLVTETIHNVVEYVYVGVLTHETQTHIVKMMLMPE